MTEVNVTVTAESAIVRCRIVALRRCSYASTVLCSLTTDVTAKKRHFSETRFLLGFSVSGFPTEELRRADRVVVAIF